MPKRPTSLESMFLSVYECEASVDVLRALVARGLRIAVVRTVVGVEVVQVGLSTGSHFSRRGSFTVTRPC